MATLQNALALYVELRFSEDSSCTPKLFLRDTTDYVSIGLLLSNRSGLFRVEFTPTNATKPILLYNNNSFIAPDLEPSASETELTLCCYEGDFCGALKITYSIFDETSGNEFYKVFNYSFCFKPFEFEIKHYLDCYKARLRSVDVTNYNVPNAKRTETAYSHQVYANSYIGITNTSKEVVITTPNLYTEAYYTKINSTQKYEFKQTSGVFTVVFSGTKEVGFEVKCQTDLNALKCCLECLQNEVRTDPFNAELQRKYDVAMGMLALHQQLLKCEKTEQASILINELFVLIDCGQTELNCSCLEVTDAVEQLLPIKYCKTCYNV